jgi:hypothetical protein
MIKQHKQSFRSAVDYKDFMGEESLGLHGLGRFILTAKCYWLQLTKRNSASIFYLKKFNAS